MNWLIIRAGRDCGYEVLKFLEIFENLGRDIL